MTMLPAHASHEAARLQALQSYGILDTLPEEAFDQLATLAARPEWKEDVLVKRFAQVIQPTLAADELKIEPLLVIDGEHRIPAALWERLRADFAA